MILGDRQLHGITAAGIDFSSTGNAFASGLGQPAFSDTSTDNAVARAQASGFADAIAVGADGANSASFLTITGNGAMETHVMDFTADAVSDPNVVAQTSTSGVLRHDGQTTAGQGHAVATAQQSNATASLGATRGDASMQSTLNGLAQSTSRTAAAESLASGFTELRTGKHESTGWITVDGSGDDAFSATAATMDVTHGTRTLSVTGAAEASASGTAESSASTVVWVGHHHRASAAVGIGTATASGTDGESLATDSSGSGTSVGGTVLQSTSRTTWQDDTTAFGPAMSGSSSTTTVISIAPPTSP
ncbi:MAG: hypothetical protein AAFX81_13385 [Pseudomonadota bacterium]